MLFNLFGAKKSSAADAAAQTPDTQVAPRAVKADPDAPSATQALALKELEADAAQSAPVLPVADVVEVPKPTPAPAPAPAPSPAPAPAPAPALVPGVPVQIDAIKATQEDVIAAYKIFLRRQPESQTVVSSRLGLSREKLFVNFITAAEFLRHPENIHLILQTAQQMEMKSDLAVKEEVK